MDYETVSTFVLRINIGGGGNVSPNGGIIFCGVYDGEFIAAYVGTQQGV